MVGRPPIMEFRMADPTFRPTAYLISGCPFCLKLRVAFSELGIADRFDYVMVDQDEQAMADARARLTEAGLKPSFPAVEVAPGVFSTESDELISRYAAQQDADPEALPLLNYYKAGVFPRYIALFRENMELKARQDA